MVFLINDITNEFKQMKKCFKRLRSHQVNLPQVPRCSIDRRGLALEVSLSTGREAARLLGLKVSLKAVSLGGSDPASLCFGWILPGLEVMTGASSLRRPRAEKPSRAPWPSRMRMTYVMSIFQPPHIMQQWCWDHVCAVLLHHEVQTGRPGEPRQWSIHPLQGKLAREPRACSDACLLNLFLKLPCGNKAWNGLCLSFWFFLCRTSYFICATMTKYRGLAGL